MRTKTSVIAALLCALACCSVVRGSGMFELRLKSFVNENGKDSLGKCCSGGAPTATGECPGTCRTRFRVCLKQYQVNIDTTTPCTYGDIVTSVLGDNVMSPSEAAGSAFANPIRFPFNFTWPGTFSLIVEAFHDNTENSTHQSTGTNLSTERVIITRLATQRWLDVGPEWIQDEHISHHSMMVYEYRVTCSPHYYGKGCEKVCKPRDDSFGHYRCSPTGEKVCLAGWKGDYCNSPHCLAGCDEQHGHCSKPNECMCHNGWSGPFCDQCVMYPGCLHGSCQKPWECLCDEGWGGLFCNQDLNFCTNHKPCRNGGTCFNTGQGSYTCACAPGFTGNDCETPLLDCQAQPCLNQGTCLPAPPSNTSIVATTAQSEGGHIENTSQIIARRYKCSCPAGWRGRHCEVSSRSCRDSPCARGATCEDDSERGFRCHCPAGFSGPDCEQKIDECASNPCANGGTCTDLVAGFMCTCPSGFTGERCQINIDDCQGSPCLNGGTCVDLVNRFRCQCVPGYLGNVCQEKVDYCITKPCANGGSCVSTTNDYQCACKPGFSGKDCSEDVDECKSSPCQHGATCRNRVNGFVCDCPDGWRGELCAESTRVGYWSAQSAQRARNPGHPGGGSVEASPEARHSDLSAERVIAIGAMCVAVPAFVLVAVGAVFCMKRRQKREQAKADEEARLQNERNAVHSSMSKRAANALLSPRMEYPIQSVAGGDSHMIKNTWTAQSSCQMSSSCSDRSSKSVNNVNNDVVYDDASCYSKSSESESRARTQKQLNTEAAAHRASQYLYQKEKECSGNMSSCHQLLQDCSKRASSSMCSERTDNSCCSAVNCSDLKRPNTCISEGSPPTSCGGDDVCGGQGSDTPGGCAVYVIDDHYRHDPAAAAALVAAATQLATEV